MGIYLFRRIMSSILLANSESEFVVVVIKKQNNKYVARNVLVKWFGWEMNEEHDIKYETWNNNNENIFDRTTPTIITMTEPVLTCARVSKRRRW